MSKKTWIIVGIVLLILFVVAIILWTQKQQQEKQAQANVIKPAINPQPKSEASKPVQSTTVISPFISAPAKSISDQTTAIYKIG